MSCAFRLENRPDALRTLLELGANPAIANIKGVLPQALAQSLHKNNLVRIFQEMPTLPPPYEPPAYEARGSIQEPPAAAQQQQKQQQQQ